MVFLLNRYFRATGQAVQAAGGRLDKFIGDGVMAIFGLDREPEVACRQALDAARRMALALDDLNEALSGDLDQPLAHRHRPACRARDRRRDGLRPRRDPDRASATR